MKSGSNKRNKLN